jgi:4-amino-4-deoxy-L-arabinose transferase-like glycosyltransferase
MAETLPNATPPQTRWWRFAEIAALLILLGLAAGLRFGLPEVIEFKRDEANLARLALDFARGRDFPLLGIGSSVGLRNAPFSVYVVTPPFLLSSDPALATYYIGALNVLAVALLYSLARRYYGVLAALIAALCLAANPWAVMFSRKLWAQNALMPFLILTVGSGLAAFLPDQRRARLAQLLHLPLLSITVQIHFAALSLVPLSFYLIWQGRQRLTRYFFASLLLAALSVVPYAIGTLDALQGGVWASAQLGSQSSAAEGGLFSTQTLEYALIVLSGTDLHSLAGAQAFARWLETIPRWAYGALTIFGALSLACGLWRLLIGVRAKQPLDIALGSWLLVPLVIFSVRWVTPQLHYLIPILPAAFLALGATLRDLIRRALFMRLWLVVVFSVAALQAVLVLHLLSFLGQTATPGGFGTPLGRYAPIRAAVLSKQPADVLMRVDGQFVGTDDEATVWDVLLYDLPHRRFLPPDLEVYPAQAAALLILGCPEPEDEAAIRGTRYAMRPLADGTPERCFTLSERRTADFDASRYTALPQAAALNIGGSLTAFAWEAQARCLHLVWRLPAPATTPFGDQFHMALSLYAQDGARLAQADGQFWLGRFWRDGDLAVSRHCLPDLPAQPDHAQIGLYTYQQGTQGFQFFNVLWQESESPFLRLPLTAVE